MISDPPASSVFGVTDYTAKTLLQLHAALNANRASRIKGTWEHGRIATVRQEMKRRGIRVERSAK